MTYKGGKFPDKNGYILVLKKNHPFANALGYVREHRLVLEEHLKCILLPWAVTHHINGIKNDNRIENLMVFFNHSKHRKLECIKDMSGRYCLLCLKTKTHIRKNNRPHWFNYKSGFICHTCYHRLKRKNGKTAPS